MRLMSTNQKFDSHKGLFTRCTPNADTKGANKGDIILEGVVSLSYMSHKFTVKISHETSYTVGPVIQTNILQLTKLYI